MSTRWHEHNCKPQCPKCNIFSEGEKWKFGKKLEAEIGVQAVEELVQLSYKSVKYSKSDLEYLIQVYKDKVKNLCE